MTRQWRVVYDFEGGRGALYISTLSRTGALQLLRVRFPGIRIVRVREVLP